jgi:hypothetical protein
MSEIETAIAEIANSGLYGNQVHQKTLELSLKALQEKQEREKGCEYCDFSSGDVGSTFPGPDNFQLIRSDDGVSITTDGFGHFRTTKIKICPMCGRELGENDG